MTKMKKINKIIPAVLLSGAMVFPVSQLSSPIIAHAYENSSSNAQKAIDYTPTITNLADVTFKNSTPKINQRSNDVVIPANGEITVDLTKKEFHQFDARLTVPEGSGSVRYQVYLDDRYIRDTGYMSSGEEKNIQIELFGDDAKELKIVATSSGNSRSNNSGLIEDAKFTTYYTDYSEKMNVKTHWEYSPYVRCSRDSAWIGSGFPSSTIYLETNKQVTFTTISDDPCLTNDEKVSITSEKGISKQAHGYGSVSVGAKIRYQVEEGFRVKQYYDEKGNVFTSNADYYTTKTPIQNSFVYDIINL